MKEEVDIETFICQQRHGLPCPAEAQKTCEACGKLICRAHVRYSRYALENFRKGLSVTPYGPDLCMTCYEAEHWGSLPIVDMSDDHRRAFFLTALGESLVGEWERTRWL